MSKQTLRFITPMLIATLALSAVCFSAWDGVVHVVRAWSKDEYSYGYFIPCLILFFIWQRKHQLVKEPFTGAWSGVVVVLLGAFILVFGELAALYTLVQYGFALSVMGIALALLGWRAFRWVAIPLLLLFFAVPLPNFLYNNLSQSLQLLSSKIGVAVVRLFGISVFLEGNVISLATMKLQVVEACSGLRYLFPLMVVGFIVAFIYRAPFWKRAILFLSTIPITVLMNSLRIGLIAVTVEYWGNQMAEGLLHDFEGWVIFMVSLCVLFAEMWILNHIGPHRARFHAVFNIDLPSKLPAGVYFQIPLLSPPLVAVLVIALLTAGVSARLPSRIETIPTRTEFAFFPLHLGSWQGSIGRLEQVYLDALKLDDSLVIHYTHAAGYQALLYAAYYQSQRKGASVHSPRSCIPGDGWELGSLSQHEITGAHINGQLLRVNRVLIKKGDMTQLVYYWFPQRGWNLTNEYMVKWYMFRDAVMRNRTDGALVRLTTVVNNNQDIEQADVYLSELTRLVAAQMSAFIPN